MSVNLYFKRSPSPCANTLMLEFRFLKTFKYDICRFFYFKIKKLILITNDQIILIYSVALHIENVTINGFLLKHMQNHASLIPESGYSNYSELTLVCIFLFHHNFSRAGIRFIRFIIIDSSLFVKKLEIYYDST